jgi:hypothetical protein
MPTFWYCHIAELGCRLQLPAAHARDTLPYPASIVRHQRIAVGSDLIFLCEAGVIVLLQAAAVQDEQEHAAVYDSNSKFDAYAQRALAVLRQFAPVGPEEVLVVFPVLISAAPLRVDWKFVRLPDDDEVLLHLFVEAVAIDHVCRTIEKTATGLLADKTLIEQRRLIGLVEGLRQAGQPTSFLVNTGEIDRMNEFYRSWNLAQRIQTIRQSFSDAIASSSLYSGQLDRNGQNAMNFLLAGLAVLSLAQVSESLSSWLAAYDLPATKQRLDQAVGVSGSVMILWGVLRHLAFPRIGVLLAAIRDRIRAWRVVQQARRRG